MALAVPLPIGATLADLDHQVNLAEPPTEAPMLCADPSHEGPRPTSWILRTVDGEDHVVSRPLCMECASRVLLELFASTLEEMEAWDVSCGCYYFEVPGGDVGALLWLDADPVLRHAEVIESPFAGTHRPNELGVPDLDTAEWSP